MTKQNKASQKSSIGKVEFTSVFQTTMIAAFSLYAAARFAAALLGGGMARIWGFDFGAFLRADWDILIVLVLPIITGIKPLRAVSSRFISSQAASKHSKKWMLALIALGSLFLATRFQVAFAFLGDGSYYAGELYRCITNPEITPAIIKPTSWLTGHALRLLTVWLRPDNIRLPFTILGIAGFVVVFAAMFLALKKEEKLTAALIAMLFLFTSGTLMFFGYVELYVMEYACVIGYLLFVHAAFRQHAQAWVPGVFLAAAILFGMSAVIFIPSYLLFLHARIRGDKGPITLRAAFIVLNAAVLLAGAALLVLSALKGTLPNVIPLSAQETIERGMATGTQGYTLFSSAHLLDLVNILFLNAPAGIIAVFVAVAFRKSLRWSPPPMLFAITALVSAAAFLLIGNTSLGLSRDWDLATIPALAFTYFAAVVFIEAHDRSLLSLPLVLPLVALVLFGGTHAWLRVNFDERASAQRLESLITMDDGLILPINRYTALENLRKYYRATHNEEQLFRIVEKMIETGWHKSDSYNKLLMEVLQKTHSPQLQQQGFAWVFDRLLGEAQTREPGNSYARIPLEDLHDLITKALLSALRTESTEHLRAAIAKFKQSDPSWNGALFVEAFLDAALTPAARAERAMQVVSLQSHDPVLIIAVARLLKQAADYALAAEYYKRALLLDPNNQYPRVYIDLAKLYAEELNDQAKSIATLRDCVAHSRGTKEAEQARVFLQRMGVAP